MTKSHKMKFVPKNNILLQSGSNTSTHDPRYATARAVYYPLLIVGLVFSTLLALALRTAPTKKSFTHQSSQAKAAFRLVLWGVALADMCHCLSVIPYLFAVWTPSESNTAALRSALEVAAVLSSTGILLSSALTACLAIEGYLIVSRGIRDGEQKRAVLYISSLSQLLQPFKRLLLLSGHLDPLNRSSRTTPTSGHIL